MDVSETLALEFLRYLGMAEIIYEPDGNVPPDFSCAGKVAVEVRRLNQHDALVRGLEEVAIPLVTKIRALLASLGPPQEASWFVTFRYRRPVEACKALRLKITSALLCFRNNPSEGVVRLPVSDRFELGLAKSSQLLATCFVLGGYSDHDSGGWTASEIIRNLAIVIPEKSKKVGHFRKKYDEWWLVLLDHIGYARLDTQELDVLREHVKRPPEWTKIFLVNPLAPQHGIEI